MHFNEKIKGSSILFSYHYLFVFFFLIIDYFMQILTAPDLHISNLCLLV